MGDFRAKKEKQKKKKSNRGKTTKKREKSEKTTKKKIKNRQLSPRSRPMASLIGLDPRKQIAELENQLRALKQGLAMTARIGVCAF